MKEEILNLLVDTREETPQSSRENRIPVSSYVMDTTIDTAGRLDNKVLNEISGKTLYISRNGVRICLDNADYLYNGIDGYDCQWVIQTDRCDREDPNTRLHVGKYFCPRSCSYCEGDTKCADNQNYQWYGRKGVGCDWLASSGRCDSVRDAAGDSSVHLGKRYCPKSCGYCQDTHDVDPFELEIDIDVLELNGPLP